MVKYFLVLILVFNSNVSPLFGQEQKESKAKDNLKYQPIDPLRPAKAAFYSAVIPGLGQIYNNSYWKLPLVYGAIGTSLYFYIDSQKKYNIYRDEYQSRLEGHKRNKDYLSRLSDNQLIVAQKQFLRNRDLSALFVVGFYVLNIIDANVDASLSQFNVNNSLSFKPTIEKTNGVLSADLGFKCVYSF